MENWEQKDFDNAFKKYVELVGKPNHTRRQKTPNHTHLHKTPNQSRRQKSQTPQYMIEG